MTFDRVAELESLTDAQVIYIDASLTARHIPDAERGKKAGDAFVIAEDGFEHRLLVNSVDRAMAEKILLTGGVEADIQYVDMLGCQVLFAGAPVNDAAGAVTGAVVLYREFTDVRSVTLTTAYVMLISLVTAGLISMVLAFVMSRHLAQPLILLTRTACHMAQGDYGETIQLTQNDEIGQLGATLNAMSRQLSATIFDLRNEKAKLEQILSGIGEGIVAVDQSGSVIHHNNAALELLELSTWQLRNENENQPYRRKLMDMLFTAMTTGERAQTQWKTGAGRAISAAVWPVFGTEKEIIGAVGLLRDVSESERLEQMRRDYVANVSHELRTPLTGIRGMVEPLMDGYIDTDEEKMECYTVIYQETLRLEKLIGEMLDMSRLQSGRLQVELEPLDVMGVMRGAVRRQKERAEECGVRLYAEEAELPMVMGSEDRIMQVLIILLDNALSFTPAGGEIRVYARLNGEKVHVGVADTGAGIDPKDLPYIWERFYKADKSRMHTTGTGLGLSIAKLVCELMNGSISVQSELGQGSTFEFTLNVFHES